MKKNMKNVKKYKNASSFFKSKFVQLLIAIVALIECAVLISFTTYSWIESSSSLIIKGKDMQVSDQLDYQIDYTSGGDTVDLSAFFSKVENFQFAKTSSPNGSTFYFPKPDKSKYRLGDTTDNNTSIRSVDFIFNNTNAQNDLYYTFKADQEVFSFPDLEGEILNKAKQIFRCSVQEGNAVPKIYAMPNTPAYNAINNTSGSSTKYVSPKAFSNGIPAFSINKGTAKKIKICIYLESQALNLTPSEWEEILSTNVQIDIGFNVTTIKPVITPGNTYFIDYSGKLSTASNIIYYYKDSKNVSHTANLLYDNSYTDGHRWVTNTINFDDNPVTVNVESNYFSQGTYKFYPLVSPSDPTANNTFSALSTYTNGTTTYGFGTWDDVSELYVDANNYTYYTSNAYNQQGTAPLSTTNHLFVNIQKNKEFGYDTNVATLTYDPTNNYWKGYLPNSYISRDIYILYNNSTSYSSNPKITFHTTTPQKNENDQYYYSVLGFSSVGNADGVGVWTGVDENPIYLNTSLFDFDSHSSDRYQVGISVDGQSYYYYMAPTGTFSDDSSYFAYVPVNAGKTSSSILSFKRIGDSATLVGGAPTAIRNNQNTCYMVYNKEKNAIENHWNVVFAVDGTAEHLVKKSFDEFNASPILAYSLDNGSTLYDMTRMDDYRWYAPLDQFSDFSQLKIVWCPYNDNEHQNVRFDYPVNLNNGKFITIVEPYDQ